MFPDDILPCPLGALLRVQHRPRPPLPLLLVLRERVIPGRHEGRGHVAQHRRGAVIDGAACKPRWKNQ